jgi:hypothetical protein
MDIEKLIFGCSGAWIVVPGIFTFIYGSEILAGLEKAAGLPAKKLR